MCQPSAGTLIGELVRGALGSDSDAAAANCDAVGSDGDAAAVNCDAVAGGGGPVFAIVDAASDDVAFAAATGSDAGAIADDYPDTDLDAGGGWYQETLLSPPASKKISPSCSM